MRRAPQGVMCCLVWRGVVAAQRTLDTTYEARERRALPLENSGGGGRLLALLLLLGVAALASGAAAAFGSIGSLGLAGRLTACACSMLTMLLFEREIGPLCGVTRSSSWLKGPGGTWWLKGGVSGPASGVPALAPGSTLCLLLPSGLSLLAMYNWKAVVGGRPCWLLGAAGGHMESVSPCASAMLGATPPASVTCHSVLRVGSPELSAANELPELSCASMSRSIAWLLTVADVTRSGR